MLKTLNVINFALVESLEIHFDPGLTVITGESGAGKSILLAALGLVLGDRASVDVVRPGAVRSEVSAEFDLADLPATLKYLGDLSLEDPDLPNRVLVRRVISSDGRSRAFLNGTPVTLQVLKGLTAGLVDVHGQHENQRLAAPEVQLAMLDDYGVDNRLKESCRESFHAWKSAAVEYERLSHAVATKEDRAALLTYQLEELNEASVVPGDFEQTEITHKRLTRIQDLQTVVADALASLESAIGLGHTLRRLQQIDDEHPALNSAAETLASAMALQDDASRDLRAYQTTLEQNPGRLLELEQRLMLLHDLSRKHKVPPEELPGLVGRLERELDAITTDRSSVDELADAAAKHEAGYRKHAVRLSRQRHQAADGFAGAVTACMNTLGIEGGALSLVFSEGENQNGLESVEFHCVTNPKYPAAPMSRIVSGGEQARISLAIQVVAAEKSALPSLVLDEADVGVGGTTADIVGRLLRALAIHTQVICVTHAPQVAALGEHHMRVHKDSDQDTRIASLSDRDRVDELARMLAGSGVTEKSRDYAQTLLSEAETGALH